MSLSGYKTAPLLTEMRVDLKGFKADMKKAIDEAVKSAKNVSDKMESVAKVGKHMSKAGENMTKYITTPLIGAGVACVKFQMDAETSFAKVGTVVDKTAVNFNDMKKAVRKASDESGVAIADFNEALYSSVSAGVESGKAVQFTSDMVKLAKGGFTDTASAVDVVTTALNAYSLGTEKATEVSDYLITTQNLGKMFCSVTKKFVA